LIVGGLAATGANVSPGILGATGIAAGGTKARDLRSVRPISFSALRNMGPVFVPFGSVGENFKQCYVGQGASCRDA
jgi:hypothetical protein